MSETASRTRKNKGRDLILTFLSIQISNECAQQQMPELNGITRVSELSVPQKAKSIIILPKTSFVQFNWSTTTALQK